MKITGIRNNEKIIRQIAEMLMDDFAGTGTAAWAGLDEAAAEVRESLSENRISRIAVENEEILGWIGGIESYDGLVWELHPLVVRRVSRNKGVGRALVADFERQVKKRGGMTVMLGTDDENFRTSLGGVDLYPNVLENLLKIENLRRHPFEFYRKMGYEITGVIPDANGFGKPDILMCKRV
jgi:aminoglycoside 6'-N-acetyltransferase I